MVRLVTAAVGVCALLASCLFPASPGRGAVSSATLLSPAALDQALTRVRRPPRDLQALTVRLKLHTGLPILAPTRRSPGEYPVGHRDQFFVAHGANDGYSRVPATLVLKTAHVYYYVQQGTPMDQRRLARSATTFERETYPTDRAIFGPESPAGVDGDRHISVFLGQIPGLDGYFSATDAFPRAIIPYSNERKILYLNAGLVQPGSALYDEVLAHEFQHMIHFHLHPADEAWINEGSSVLAQVLNGYSASGFDADKATRPDTQLNTWSIGDFAPYYGGGYLWMLYLYEHFGGARVIRAELADSGLSNMALFDDVLARLGVRARADDVFADWVVANFLNDPAIAGGRYGYTHSTVRAVSTASLRLPFRRQRVVHQYAADYLTIANPGGRAFTLRFAGTPTVPLLGTHAPAPVFWWSNRGDMVDTTLTLPPLDLRAAPRATLTYQAWYDLERDADYGYVEVSADSGKTWYPQRTAHTTRSNPNGANLGNGYTGSSCPAHVRGIGCWVSERVDLSAYTGKRVLVRFEQVTDDEYNQQGVALAHLRVPEIGFDGDSLSHGWQAAGWVQVRNSLAERWIVQAMIYHSHGVTIRRMPVGADGRGHLSIPGGATQVVVAVSAVAPLTTVTNGYALGGGA